MRKHRILRVLGLLRTAVAIALGFAAMSAQAGQGGDYSYVSEIEGSATVSQQDGSSVEATQNLPIGPGDTLDTRSGNVEVRLSDGALLRAGRGSRVRFSEIAGTAGSDAQASRIDLSDGSIELDIPSDAAEVRVDTGNASAYLNPGGRYRIDALDDDESQVIVFSGEAEVLGRDGNAIVRDGQIARIDGDDAPELAAYDFDDQDSFGRWSASRSNDRDRGGRVASNRYVSGKLSYSTSTLNDHGDWYYMDEYSSYGWHPRVGRSWRPYSTGSWYSTSAGLCWNSREPWGWAPYHYGNWVLSSHYGWIWIPGYSYSPAWVYWYSDPYSVGWCPMGYYDARYRNQYDYYSGGYYGGYRSRWSGLSININIGGFDHRPWNWLRYDDFNNCDRYGDLSGRLRTYDATRRDAARPRKGHDTGGILIAEPILRAPRDLGSHEELVKAVLPASRRGSPARQDGIDINGYFGDDGKLDRRTRDTLLRDKPERSTDEAISRLRERGVRSPQVTRGPERDDDDRVSAQPWRTERAAEKPARPARQERAKVPPAVTEEPRSPTTTRPPRTAQQPPSTERGSEWRERDADSGSSRRVTSPPSRDAQPSERPQEKPDWRERGRSNNEPPRSSPPVRESTREDEDATPYRRVDSDRSPAPERRSVARRVIDEIAPSAPRVQPVAPSREPNRNDRTAPSRGDSHRSPVAAPQREPRSEPRVERNSAPAPRAEAPRREHRESAVPNPQRESSSRHEAKPAPRPSNSEPSRKSEPSQKTEPSRRPAKTTEEHHR